MENIISIYEQLIVKQVTYESGDSVVKAFCDVIVKGRKFATEMMISQSDLNRIIAKITALGIEFQVNQVNHIPMEDGSEIIDYSFENVFGEGIVLEDFYFNQKVQELRA
ncbi:hypothetical protein [Crocinitomix algicola]|uniref:hypothetical protein n=1 Tax=Crocinitomix algicola TaxID=1740263 RepID=UPI00087261C9|nr:hypothetical protein [Crocinitomix algicola]